MSDRIFLNARFGFRHDILSNWQSENPVLLKGEISIVSDAENENWLKIGDGATAWNDLPYKVGPKGNIGIQGEKGDKGDKGDDAITDQTYNASSVNAQSGIAVAQAVASMNKSYELIEKIITAEEMVTIHRDREPDGTPYRFDKVQLMFEVPKATDGSMGRIVVNGTTTNYMGSIISASWNACSEAYVEVLKGSGLIRTNYAQHTNAFSNAAKADTTVVMPNNASDYITMMQFVSDIGNSKPFPIGTKITIYGIRA